GQGWQAIQAARLALKGETMERILGAVESIKRRTRVFIQIETLANLRRGGRAAKLMPTIDRFMRVLNLRPLLHIEEGELKLLGMARSTSKGIKKIAEEVAALGPLEFIAVMHIRCQNAAEQLAEEIARLVHIPREEIWLGEAGAVLACHGGEGTLGAVAVVAE
ncbi:MAG: DegV family EDD domain-containing protein, partial [Chloroflexi bacterium]|nr:DegV family EDD domain-containing protein [Chloroflexota bacterium]